MLIETITAALARDQSRTLRHTGILDFSQAQVECFLALVQTPTGLCHQHRQLSVGARSTDVLDHDITSGTALSDLDLRAARATRGLPHQHHRATLPRPRGVSITPAATP